MILDVLDKHKRLSTSKIASLISANQYRTESLLEELKKEKKVESSLTKQGMFWKLL